MPLSLQRLLPADWPALAGLIHDLNRRPGGGIRCLHAAHGADVASHATELASLPPDEAAFWSIDQGDTRVGMLGCEFDPASGRAWLRGPLAAEPAVLDELLPLAGPTLEAALPGIRRFDAFPSADDDGLNAWYAAAGFTALLVHTVLRAPTGPQRGSPLPNVRRAAPSDLPAVWALHEALFPEGYLAEADFGRALDPDADRALFVAADAHDAPIGYLHVQDNDADHEAYVDYLGIDEARRGRGLGRRLLEAASDWGAQRGRPHVALTVREDRRSAQALYRNAGFAEISVGRHWRKDLGAAAR